MIDFLTETVQHSWAILITSALLFFTQAITIFGIRILQYKRVGRLPPGHPELPEWTTILYPLEWVLRIILLILNWKFALLFFLLLFILKVLPVLELIGNILMAPFKPRNVDACWTAGIVAKKALEVAEKNAGEAYPDVALSLYFRGLEAARQDSYDIAVKMLTKAIREHPDFPEAYVARGCVRLWFKNEHQLAVDDHTKAISLRPDWAYAYFHRADTYWDEGQNHKALPDCNMGIRLDPDFAAGYVLRAAVHKELEQQKQAREDEGRAEQLGFSSGDTGGLIPCPWDVTSGLGSRVWSWIMAIKQTLKLSQVAG